jgi:biopolymer transport protein ExbB/TolQ
MFVFSFNTLASAGVYYAFENSDLCGKSIVVLMLVSSIVTWSIILEKWLSSKRLGSSSTAFVRSFTQKRTFLMSIEEAKNNVGPTARIYGAALARVVEFHGINEGQLSRMARSGQKPDKPLNEPQLAVIRAAVDKEMSDQIRILETRMGVLGTCVSAPPFFGLFGTVWGVMLAFCSLAEKGRAEISALAPGVAGALLTTVAGLVVAIPALIGYNLLTAIISTQITELEDFSEQMMAQLKVEQTEYETAAAPASTPRPAAAATPYTPPVQTRQVQPQGYAQAPVYQQPQVQPQQPPPSYAQTPVYQQPQYRQQPQTVFMPNPAPQANDSSSVQPDLLNS